MLIMNQVCVLSAKHSSEFIFHYRTRWSRQFGIFNSKTDKRQPPPSVTTHIVQRPFRFEISFSLSKASLHRLRSDVRQVWQCRVASRRL